MKIAVSSKGNDLDSEVDPRFGRAAYVLIVDSETFDFEVIDNKNNANAFKGAGIQAASSISKAGAEILLTGYCGPNAFKATTAANIKVVNGVTGIVRDAMSAFKRGELSFSEKPNVEGQWT